MHCILVCVMCACICVRAEAVRHLPVCSSEVLSVFGIEAIFIKKKKEESVLCFFIAYGMIVEMQSFIFYFLLFS